MAEKKDRLVKGFVYIVPLSRVYWGRRTNRADRAVKLLKRFVARHVKADRIIIYNEVNNYIWSRGREKPPRRVKILVLVYEVEVEEEEEKKKITVARVKLAPKELKPGPFQPATVAK